MSDRISPFAALTGAEKQIKWLEYQSVRLPYIQTTAEQIPEAFSQAPSPQSMEVREEKNSPPPTPASHSETSSRPSSPQRPSPPPEVFVSSQAAAGNDFQRTRHSQYDAVIARMKQAELQARTYHTMS